MSKSETITNHSVSTSKKKTSYTFYAMGIGVLSYEHAKETEFRLIKLSLDITFLILKEKNERKEGNLTKARQKQGLLKS